jgi:hypothetical protein
MAYVPGYEFDLFISYAHVDNAAIVPAHQGWIDVLHDILRNGLDVKLGRHDMCSIWRDDQNLRGNQEISGHIPDQVRNSANFLAILSPGYLASKHCLHELRTFLDNVKLGATERLFVVYKEPIDESSFDKMPEAFRDLRKYQFWIRDRNQATRLLGSPLPRDDVAEDRKYYYPMINGLGADIVKKLRELKAISECATPRPLPEIRQREFTDRILLAQVTDDLDGRREEVLRYLELVGVRPLPAGVYRQVRNEFEQALLADLEKCKAFVQLLGPFPGKTPPDVPEGYARLQLNLAKSKGVPIFQWRSPDLNVKEVSSEAQRQLLQADTVLAVAFEEFKQTIVTQVKRKEYVKPDRPPFIFVNAAPEDMNQGQRLVDVLGDSYSCEMALYEISAKAEDVENEINTRLIDSDAIIVVYGETGVRWVTAQLRQIFKLAPKRAKDPRLIAVVTESKEKRTPIPIKLPGMLTFPFDEAPTRIKAALAM